MFVSRRTLEGAVECPVVAERGSSSVLTRRSIAGQDNYIPSGRYSAGSFDSATSVFSLLEPVE